MQVSVLPGGAGVALDYEILYLAPGPVLGRVQHTVIGKADDGTTIMVIAHNTHGEGITILRETQPGVFEPGDGPAPHPMTVTVRLSVPEPGKLRHAWSSLGPGYDEIESDVAELEFVTQ